MRVLERELFAHYEKLVARLGEFLTVGNLALVTEIANLPDMVRGYEDVKARNVAQYLQALKRFQSETGLDLTFGSRLFDSAEVPVAPKQLTA